MRTAALILLIASAYVNAAPQAPAQLVRAIERYAIDPERLASWQM